MSFKIVRNDITKVKADVIVNTANPNPICASGTDLAIYEAAGKEKLLAERANIGKIARGDIAVTGAYSLNAKYIIHTVGPVWTDGLHHEFEILEDCYRKSLQKALELKCDSIAFPLISTGVYGFPKDKALQIAATNTSAAFTSIVNAIIIAPNTINGERRNSRSTMLIPFCTWLISLVILVTSVDVPSVSISVNENVWICANKLCLIPVAAPTAALALKYCAVMAHTSPMIASSISIRHICIMYPLSALTIPLSITDDTTSGTNSSNIASSILKSGARTHSFL